MATIQPTIESSNPTLRSESILSKPMISNGEANDQIKGKIASQGPASIIGQAEEFYHCLNIDRHGSVSTEASVSDTAHDCFTGYAEPTGRLRRPPGLVPLADLQPPPPPPPPEPDNSWILQQEQDRFHPLHHRHLIGEYQLTGGQRESIRQQQPPYYIVSSQRRHTAYEKQNNRLWPKYPDSFTEGLRSLTARRSIDVIQKRRFTSDRAAHPPPPPPPPQHISPLLRVTIISAITSLYDDCLKPTFVELKRRLQEYNMSPRLLRDLPTICLALDQDLIVDVKAKEVYLVQPPPNFTGFVDAKDPRNPFSCCDWMDFIGYVSRLMQVVRHIKQSQNTPKDISNWTDAELMAVETKMNQALKTGPQNGNGEYTPVNNSSENSLHFQFQGGRYGMASKMRTDWRLQSARLRDMSLGHLCHLVQLSIAAGIMQYENNILQPRATCLRISAAFAQSDIEPERLATQREAVRDVAVLQEALNNILKEYPEGILLSQLKFKFESQLPSRLCQSVFGCTRLSNLLQLPAFQDVCRLIVDGQGRVITQSIDYLMPPNTKLLHKACEDQTLENGHPLFQIKRCRRCRKPPNYSDLFWGDNREPVENDDDDQDEITSSLSFVPPCWKTIQSDRDAFSEEGLQFEDHPEIVHSVVQLVGCL